MEAKVAAPNIDHDILKYTNINKFYVNTANGEIYLTRKEYDCLSLWFCGKSAKQLAPILGISFRAI